MEQIEIDRVLFLDTLRLLYLLEDRFEYDETKEGRDIGAIVDRMQKKLRK